MNSKSYKEAIDDFSTCITLASPDAASNATNKDICSRCYLCRAKCKKYLKQLDTAINDFSSALDVTAQAQQRATIFMERAICYDMLDKHKLAIADYSNFLQVSKSDSKKTIQASFQEYQALHNRGLAYVQIKEMKNATDDFTSAIELIDSTLAKAQEYAAKQHKETFAESFYQRGRCHEQSKQTDAAVQDYRQALKLNDKHSRAHYYLAYVTYSCFWSPTELFTQFHHSYSK